MFVPQKGRPMPHPITLAQGKVISILTQLGRAGAEERYATIRLEGAHITHQTHDVMIPLDPQGDAWDTLKIGDSYFLSALGPIPSE